jgi:hydroxymethylglutaryl-CoA reductase
MAAVGLAQNFAALKALVTEGIQKGHMRLHARQVALAAGAIESEVNWLTDVMREQGNFQPAFAQESLARFRAELKSKPHNSVA